MMLGSGNHDEEVFPDPSTFDPTHENVKKHLGLGHGAHFCMGAPLARLEMQIALPILFERCPNLALTQQPQYANVYHFHGLQQLMVTR